MLVASAIKFCRVPFASLNHVLAVAVAIAALCFKNGSRENQSTMHPQVTAHVLSRSTVPLVGGRARPCDSASISEQLSETGMPGVIEEQSRFASHQNDAVAV